MFSPSCLDVLSYEEGFGIKLQNAWRWVGSREAKGTGLSFQELWSRRENRCVPCCRAEDNKYRWGLCCSVSFLPTNICWAPTICISSWMWNELPGKTVSSVTEIFKQRLSDCQGYSTEDFWGKMDEWPPNPFQLWESVSNEEFQG